MQTAREKHKRGKSKNVYAFVMIASICQGPNPRSLTLNCVHLITRYIKRRWGISFSHSLLFFFISRFWFPFYISWFYQLFVSFVICFQCLNNSSMTKSMIWSTNWRANRVSQVVSYTTNLTLEMSSIVVLIL